MAEKTKDFACMTKALSDAQNELLGCVGPLIVLAGFLEQGDPALEAEEAPHILLAASVTVRDACDRVKKALDYTYKVL
jgi:hypothetical protein